MPAPDHSASSSSSEESKQPHSGGSTTTTTDLPPGMVLGPDGKPCRTCTDWKSWSKIGKSKSSKSKKDSHPQDPTTTTTTTTTTGNSPGSSSLPRPDDDCPPDREVLGRATWTFLHTMAAYYPDRPSALEQSTMSSLLSSFSQFYPCGHCAEHLRTEMKINPPTVSSRRDLGLWMCGIHNKVNEVLGKDLFDCNKVDERWKDGPPDGRCD